MTGDRGGELDLERALQIVLDLVSDCGKTALRYQEGGADILDVRHKPMGGGPITEADRVINDTLVQALRAEFPEHALLAEESPDDGSWRTASWCWYIDPIDGTREFARGRPGWTVQLGLCHNGQPVLGVVAQPAHDRVGWAVADGGGWRASPELGVSGRSLSELMLIGGKLFPFSRQHAIRRALGVTRKRANSVGSVGVRMASVAYGSADAYVQAPGKTKLWDTCGPLCLVQAAGGLVTDLRGQPLRFRSETITHLHGVVVAYPPVHAQILERLAPLTKAWLAKAGV